MADNSQHRNQSNDPADLQKRAAERGAPSKGMTSPDSTQVPLRADTGEPDEEAMGGRGGQQSSGGSADR